MTEIRLSDCMLSVRELWGTRKCGAAVESEHRASRNGALSRLRRPNLGVRWWLAAYFGIWLAWLESL